MDDHRRFWSSQTSSGGRSEADDYWRAKAIEQAALVRPEHRAVDAVDLGCGAGELLRHLVDHLHVTAGLDYSESMLYHARTRLGERSAVALRNDEVFEYLPSAAHQVWLATQSLNQYLPVERLCALLDVFVANDAVRAAYFFDCVDPLRFSLLPHGIAFQDRGTPKGWSPRATARRARRNLDRLEVAARLAAGRTPSSAALRARGMGYGYLPGFWRAEAAARSLQLELIGSRAFEYRYHALLFKDASAELEDHRATAGSIEAVQR